MQVCPGVRVGSMPERDEVPSPSGPARAWAKPLRSYRLRGRSLTPALQAAFDTLDNWAFPVTPAAAPIAPIASYHDDAISGGDWNTRAQVESAADFVDLPGLFGRDGEVAMEIGFGMAEATIEMARAQPEVDLIAVEVHRPGIASLLRGIAQWSLTNVRVAHGDAVEILTRQIAPATLGEVRVFFPDPWPKAGHHRRRLVDAEFVALVASRLHPGGRLHIATDWEHYAHAARHAIAAEASLRTLSSSASGFVERPAYRPMTRFERRGIAKGHGVWDLIAVRR